MTQLISIQGAQINLFRGQLAQTKFSLYDENAVQFAVPTGTTGSITVTTLLGDDSASVIHQFTDVYENGGFLWKDWSQADTRLLPIGSFLIECRCTIDPDPEQVFIQGTLNVYPTQMG